MRTLLFMLLSVTVLGQAVDKGKVRNEYALGFAESEHIAYEKTTEDLWEYPFSLGYEFESTNEFVIYKVDCPPNEIFLDSDMYLKVPVGTKVRVAGEEIIGRDKFYELRVDMPEDGVVRTYLRSFELDDIFFPENESTRASFYMSFENRDREIKRKLMAKYKISAEELRSILWNVN